MTEKSDFGRERPSLGPVIAVVVGCVGFVGGGIAIDQMEGPSSYEQLAAESDAAWKAYLKADHDANVAAAAEPACKLED